jgi:predicted HicB family RNase H-like nuclease
MAKRTTTYRLGPDIPETETLQDSQGRAVDDAYVDSAVEEAVAAARGRGRPSLSRSGESPLLRVRLSRELDEAVARAAKRAGVSRSEWVRHALDEAAREAG